VADPDTSTRQLEGLTFHCDLPLFDKKSKWGALPTAMKTHTSERFGLAEHKEKRHSMKNARKQV
jgi:hypothetical protein